MLEKAVLTELPEAMVPASWKARGHGLLPVPCMTCLLQALLGRRRHAGAPGAGRHPCVQGGREDYAA